MKPEDLILKEYEHAWQHYRQNETRLSQLIAAHFAFVGVLTAAALGLLGRSEPDAPLLIVALAVINGLIFLVTVFVLLSAVKLQAILWHYRSAIDSSRARLQIISGCDELERKFLDQFNPSKSENYIVRGIYLGLQIYAQILLVFIFVASVVAAVALVAYSGIGRPLPWLQAHEFHLVFGVLLLILIAVGFVVWRNWGIWPYFLEIRVAPGTRSGKESTAARKTPKSKIRLL